MKRNDLIEIKKLDQKALIDKVRSLQGEIADLIVDKNMSKLKDIRAVYKKRKDLAQVLTVLRQKQLLNELESKIESSSEIEKSSKKKGVEKTEGRPDDLAEKTAKSDKGKSKSV